MAEEAVRYYGEDIRNRAVGTGPFILKKWVKGSYIEAVRNPAYRPDFYPTEGMPEDRQEGLLADAGLPVPFADRIIWRIIEEDQPRWLMFMRGRLDINSIPKDNFGQAVAFGKNLTEEMTQKGIRLQTYIEPNVFYLSFNMADPVLGTNKPLRLAINYAIDREKFIDLLMNGRGIVAHGFISPAMEEYDPNICTVSRSVLDLEKARFYLRQAEQLHGGPIPRLRLAVGGTDTTYRQIAQFFQRNIQELGLQVQIEVFDWPTFLEKMRTNQLQLIGGTGWMADYPDTESFLQVFYGPNASWPNSSNYSNPEFDRLYEQTSVMPPSPERTRLYREAERIVIEDMPVAFVYHRIGYVLYHDWVGNFKANAYKAECMGGGFAKYYRIDAAKRSRYWMQEK
jgi:ABC-type transport system substrate-binding protein